eukprot:CAMPEP_0116924710 /NCGR_PEP_ID=MMETSP0467-20121206/23680_1 /TAXON_ID=283647 /ORGANISM="Mesodinium pulex, Strain SPMC105" /LENGTH=47 /DNA_ID= /DNA_START= /DNA_END= /DNA_ORIENTATION=
MDEDPVKRLNEVDNGVDKQQQHNQNPDEAQNCTHRVVCALALLDDLE